MPQHGLEQEFGRDNLLSGDDSCPAFSLLAIVSQSSGRNSLTAIVERTREPIIFFDPMKHTEIESQLLPTIAYSLAIPTPRFPNITRDQQEPFPAPFSGTLWAQTDTRKMGGTFRLSVFHENHAF